MLTKDFIRNILFCTSFFWCSSDLAKPILQGTVKGGETTRQTEEEVERQHQGMERPGVRQVPKGNGEQRKMEELAVKSSVVAQRPLRLRDRWDEMRVALFSFLPVTKAHTFWRVDFLPKKIFWGTRWCTTLIYSAVVHLFIFIPFCHCHKGCFCFF